MFFRKVWNVPSQTISVPMVIERRTSMKLVDADKLLYHKRKVMFFVLG